MKDMTEIRKKSDRELEDFVNGEREVLRQERFKDKISRKASVIRTAKQNIAQALTELGDRRRNPKQN